MGWDRQRVRAPGLDGSRAPDEEGPAVARPDHLDEGDRTDQLREWRDGPDRRRSFGRGGGGNAPVVRVSRGRAEPGGAGRTDRAGAETQLVRARQRHGPAGLGGEYPQGADRRGRERGAAPAGPGASSEAGGGRNDDRRGSAGLDRPDPRPEDHARRDRLG